MRGSRIGMIADKRAARVAARGPSPFARFRRETQRCVRHQHRVFDISRDDLGRRRHARPQQQLGIVDFQHGFISHDAGRRGARLLELLRRGRRALGVAGSKVHLSDARREAPTRERIDGEARFLAHFHRADVGFVHRHVQLHLLQVFRHDEQHRRLHRRRHGLAGFDRAHQDHAIDGRADLGLARDRCARFRSWRAIARPPLFAAAASPSARATAASATSMSCCDGNLLPLSSRTFSRRAQIGFRFLGARIRLQHARLGRCERAFRLQHLRLQARRVEHGQHLAGFDLIVHIDIHLGDRAGQLAADFDLIARLEIAGGGDGHRHIAGDHILRDVSRRLGAVATER